MSSNEYKDLALAQYESAKLSLNELERLATPDGSEMDGSDEQLGAQAALEEIQQNQ